MACCAILTGTRWSFRSHQCRQCVSRAHGGDDPAGPGRDRHPAERGHPGFPSLIERITRSFDYEACLLGLVNDDLDPDAQMNVWLSSAENHQWNPDTETPATAWEAEIDRLMRAQAAEMDAGEAEGGVDRVQEIVWQQEPFIYLVNRDALVAISPDLHNARPVALAAAGVLEYRRVVDEQYREDSSERRGVAVSVAADFGRLSGQAGCAQEYLSRIVARGSAGAGGAERLRQEHPGSGILKLLYLKRGRARKHLLERARTDDRERAQHAGDARQGDSAGVAESACGAEPGAADWRAAGRGLEDSPPAAPDADRPLR